MPNPLRTAVFGTLLAAGLKLSIAYTNVYGEDLRACSQEGMALTGYTRTGYCVDQQDDSGSHHICIDLNSTSGGNFCSVTGQSDWCSGDSACDGGDDDDASCPIQNWCVCQWAFANYLESAGGCDMVQEIVCEAINMEAAAAYRTKAGTQKYRVALRCLEERCGISLQEGGLRSFRLAQMSALSKILLVFGGGASVSLMYLLTKKKDAIPGNEYVSTDKSGAVMA